MQTGRSFQSLLNLGDDDLAIRVGDAASRTLFERRLNEAEDTGSGSSADLLDETSHVLFEGNLEASPVLSKALKNPQMRALLVAPILVCTVDHLIPATEATRGGRQIAPMLRLLSGDLVLDEPDDFDIGDLPALTRLVNWAGLLGARVLLSSATLPPALVRGLFEAYREGRRFFKANRSPNQASEAEQMNICCMWVDEFSAKSSTCRSGDEFEATHQEFANQRATKLSEAAPRRRFEVRAFAGTTKNTTEAEFSKQALEAAIQLHKTNHIVEPATGIRASFGLIRMANIGPLFEAAKAMYQAEIPADVCVHLCVYHSQFPLIVRSEIEKLLDRILDRRGDPLGTLQHPIVAAGLDNTYSDHLFIVLGSPVTEVGRDHDYDWAVVEPSSMRSIIQLAGRVRRHREGGHDPTNIVLFDCNIRHLKKPNEPSYQKPGFESSSFRLDTAKLSSLLPSDLNGVIDSRPRIVSKSIADLKPRTSLIDLEHARLGKLMRYSDSSMGASDWWARGPLAQLTGLLPKAQEFRKQQGERVDVYLRPTDDGDATELVQIMQTRGLFNRSTAETVEEHRHRVLGPESVGGAQVRPWCESDYLILIKDLAEERDEPVQLTARRFGQTSLPVSDNGWVSHPSLGFNRRK